MTEVACVLSGGGAKAAAHVGAMRALEESGGRAGRFVATSMGAVIAAGFASGLGYDEMVRRMGAVGGMGITALSPSLLKGPFATSLLRSAPLRTVIGELVPAERFGDLGTPLTVTAVDAESGGLELFGAGGRDDVPLHAALYASCALPVYFPSARIGGRRFADGGLRAVLPLDVAAAFQPRAMFAVHVGPSFEAERPERRRGPPMLRAHDGAMHALMASQMEDAVARARAGPIPLVLVRPSQYRQATFAADEVARYVEEGYRAAVQALAEGPGSS
jgi:NTE family protein